MRKISLLCCCLALTFWSRAEVKVPAIFGDNMMLQQESKVKIWGTAKPGSTVNIKGSWGKSSSATADKDGKWIGKLETPKAGGPYTVSLSDGKALTIKNVLIGEVWLCGGQSNMEMPVKGFANQPVVNANEYVLQGRNSKIRLFTVKRNLQSYPVDTLGGEWFEATAESINDFSAAGYFFGLRVHQVTGLPVGLISSNYGGSPVEAWISREVLAKDYAQNHKLPSSSADFLKPKPHYTPSVLFNGMINPIIGYGIRGAIWYQGESNVSDCALYEKTFPAMVADWRNRWGIGEFPLYYCQIAPYSRAFFPEMRDVQRRCMNLIPNSGMACLLDLGEELCIHPSQKKTTGDRLAVWALAKTYGIQGITYCGPLFESVSYEAGKATVKFSNVGTGLTSYNKPINSFEIADSDKIFYPAQAVLGKDGTVVLTHPAVKTPAAVRYAFKAYADYNFIYNTAGLPAASFRTDKW